MTIRSTSRVLALAALLLFAAPAASRAAETGEPHKVRVTLAFFTGFQGYSMDAINDHIASRNAEFEAEPLLAAAGLELDDLKSGSAFGAGIRVWPRRELVLAADYQRMGGSSSASVPVSGTPGAPSFKAEVKAPAQTVSLSVGYLVDWPSKTIRFGAAAGGMYILCDGASVLSFPGYKETVELRGDGFGFQGLALADFHVSDTIQFEVGLGYRSGKTGALENLGTVVLNPDGSEIKADYSGIVTRFGINVPFGPR